MLDLVFRYAVTFTLHAAIGVAFVLAPIVFGYVSEHFGWRPVFVIVGVTYALCALSWLVIDCTLPLIRDSDPRSDESPIT